MNKTKRIAFGIGILLTVLAVFTASAAALPWEAWLDPQDSTGDPGEDTYVEQWVTYDRSQQSNPTWGALAYQVDIHFDPDCVNITSADFSTSPFGGHMFTPYAPGVVRILEHNYTSMLPLESGTYKMYTLTFHAESSGSCACDIWFDVNKVSDEDGEPIANSYTDGTYTCVAPTYMISGIAKTADDKPANNVTIRNRNNSKEWEADVNDTGFYTLTLTPGVDVNATEILQIVADKKLSCGYSCPENYTYKTNVTRHEVEDIAGETVDLTLNHFRINYYPDYQYFTQDDANYSGAAVIQMWADFKGVSYTQEQLQAWGLDNNTAANQAAGVPYVDPKGMERTMIGAVPLPPGHYFDARVRDTFTHAMHETCWWQWTGPGAHPTDGYYAKWMAVRGIHTDKNPRENGYWGYNVYGLWINDPNKTAASIGANSYKTAEEWNTTHYYAPITDNLNEQWDGKYVTLVEPPPAPDVEVGIVSSPARFNAEAKEAVQAARAVQAQSGMKAVGGMDAGMRVMAEIGDPVEEANEWIVQAAIDGAMEQLAPFDPAFAAIFDDVVAVNPMLVTSDAGDYYLVPFAEKTYKNSVEQLDTMIADLEAMKRDVSADYNPAIQSSIAELTSLRNELNADLGDVMVVIIVDAEDGHFKEASWVEEPMKYLPVSAEEALEIVSMEIGGEPDSAVIELVQRGSGQYYPDWKVTVAKLGMEFFVSQDGTLSYDDTQLKEALKGTLENNVEVFGELYKEYGIEAARDVAEVAEYGLDEQIYNDPREFVELIRKSTYAEYEVVEQLLKTARSEKEAKELLGEIRELQELTEKILAQKEVTVFDAVKVAQAQDKVTKAIQKLTERPPRYSSYLTCTEEYTGWGAGSLDPTGMVDQIDDYYEQGIQACVPIGPGCLPEEIAKEILENDPCEAWYITGKPVGVIVPCPEPKLLPEPRPIKPGPIRMMPI